MVWQEMGDGGRAQRLKARGAKRPETQKKPLAEVRSQYTTPLAHHKRLHLGE